MVQYLIKIMKNNKIRESKNQKKMQTNKKMYNIVRRTSLPSLRTFAPKIFKQAILDVSPNKLVGYLPSHKFIIERRLVKGTARIGYAFGKPCQRLGINIFRYGFWIEEYINFDTIIVPFFCLFLQIKRS